MAKARKAKSAPAKKAATPKKFTISEDGCTVTRHHKDGDSVQSYPGNPEAAAAYAASIK